MENLMKRKDMAVLVFLLAAGAQAQNTFMNEQLTNSSQDVIGSARYVGMGGAMGALGADLGTMAWNPAGIGLYRKSDVGLTFGGQWNKQRIANENRGTGTFDQMGFVYSVKLGNKTCPFFNVGFNYQKKANYNYNFYADNARLNGLSQMDQVAELASNAYDTGFNLAGMAVDNDYLTPIYGNEETPDKPTGYYNKYGGESSLYTRHAAGSLQGYDINFSANLKDRAYVGLNLGFDNVDYRSWSEYTEYNSYVNEAQQTIQGDYTLYNDQKVTGYGINVKLGFIVRPIEDNSFRIGLAMETPTWYRMKSSVLYDLTDMVEGQRTNQKESYLEYTIRSPWKVRASMGSTVGKSFAWDVDYEYANYGSMHMGYPKYNEWDDYHTSFANTTDKAMNSHAKQTLKGVHTLRAGVEFRPTSALALRLGYNYITSAYKDQVGFDQYSINSAAMDYATSTSYMRWGDTNILTLGIGYRIKGFYVDLAYKVRNQSADFHAFDTSFAQGEGFIQANPDLPSYSIDPVDVNMTRQSIVCSLGFKF